MTKNAEAKYTAISPLDGRYGDIGESLSPYFSEFALMRYRVKIEVEWLIFLVGTLEEDDLPPGAQKLTEEDEKALRSLYEHFERDQMARIKEIEAEISHDVKAVEIFIGEWLGEDDVLSPLKPLVHIGCTSEDINNLAYTLMFKDGMGNVWQKDAKDLIDKLFDLAREWAAIPMLAHTHGQPATPTTLGKEVSVMANRLASAFHVAANIRPMGKFNGATGTYAAISVAYPNYSWSRLDHTFVTSLGLVPNLCTTQIEPHDWLAENLDAIRRFNNILRNIDQDLWTYISMEYLVQMPKAGEVGSSTMPHKINPIRFENSEANCEVGNGLCQVLADQLVNSRMQRDLTDSSLIRNQGLAVGYSVQAIRYCLAGLNRIAPGVKKLAADLDAHPEVLAEAIQTVLRKHGVPDAYNQLKEATRGKEITRSDISRFIYDISANQLADNPSACEDLKRLARLDPKDYTGYAAEIAIYTLV